ncbi:zonular occludens toxin domain-containing protein [Pectobacterium versatile]|uniref:zonular occludens toxin domain-containing protein n=1 Tax=Pectobacterium versatile TaxID=2488639 RepID=UPI001CCB25CD|nr:zonular occludens toxin domain-containing protein [Pectobacterium versatile]
MSITAYIGINGSGKTYEVVRSVMLPAFLNGRRIVTNIEGVTHENFMNFMNFILNDEKLKDVIPGIVIPVSDDDVNKEDFLPYKGAGDTFCKSGDLICIDEAWRFWETDKMLLKGHRSMCWFFMAHQKTFKDYNKLFHRLIPPVMKSMSAVMSMKSRPQSVTALVWRLRLKC